MSELFRHSSQKILRRKDTGKDTLIKHEKIQP